MHAPGEGLGEEALLQDRLFPHRAELVLDRRDPLLRLPPPDELAQTIASV